MTKKIKLIIILITVLQINLIYGQSEGVSINTTNNPPDPSAILDIQHDNKGILIPRVSLLSLTSQTTPVENPAEGLLIYNDDETVVPKGFYYWTGSMWNQFTTQGNIQLNLDVDNNLSVTGGNTISLSQINTDNQQLNLLDNQLSISNGNNVNLSNIKPNVEFAIYQDIKPEDTSPGNFISGIWVTRTLNTTTFDNSENINLDNNIIQLSPGTYLIECSTPAYNTDNHSARLQNITNNTSVLIGTLEIALNNDVCTRSFIIGVITISEQSNFEIQHWCLSNGYLGPTQNGQQNVYTQIYIQKLN